MRPTSPHLLTLHVLSQLQAGRPRRHALTGSQRPCRCYLPRPGPQPPLRPPEASAAPAAPRAPGKVPAVGAPVVSGTDGGRPGLLSALLVGRPRAPRQLRQSAQLAQQAQQARYMEQGLQYPGGAPPGLRFRELYTNHIGTMAPCRVVDTNLVCRMEKPRMVILHILQFCSL